MPFLLRIADEKMQTIQFNQIAKRTIFYEMFIMIAFAQVTVAKSNASSVFYSIIASSPMLAWCNNFFSPNAHRLMLTLQPNSFSK